MKKLKFYETIFKEMTGLLSEVFPNIDTRLLTVSYSSQNIARKKPIILQVRIGNVEAVSKPITIIDSDDVLERDDDAERQMLELRDKLDTLLSDTLKKMDSEIISGMKKLGLIVTVK